MTLLQVPFWPTAADEDIAIRTIVGEIGGGTPAQMRNVAWVIRHRLEAQDGQWAKDDTLASVCLRHLQFSCWTRQDPNFSRMHSCGPADRVYRLARLALFTVLEAHSDYTDAEGIKGDPLNRAKHYHAKSMPARIWPEWRRLVHPGDRFTSLSGDARVSYREPDFDDDAHLFFCNVP